MLFCVCAAIMCWCLQRHQEAESLRALRAEESRVRFDYIRSRADAANEQDMVKRDELERRLQVRRQLTEWLPAVGFLHACMCECWLLHNLCTEASSTVGDTMQSILHGVI